VAQFDLCFTLGELRTLIENRVKSSLVQLQKSNNIIVRTKFLRASSDEFKLLETMHKYFLGIELDETKFLKLAYAAYQRSQNA